MKVSIIGGAGYVGLITGLGLAQLGHKVTNIDIAEEKIKILLEGKSPIYEEDIESVLKKCLSSGNINFTTEPSDSIPDSDVIIIAVGTPSNESGDIDLTQIKSAIDQIKSNFKPYKVVVMKSTVPLDAVELMRQEFSKQYKEGKDFDIVSNPEFLREGKAVFDFFNPERIVIGTNSEKAFKLIEEMYLNLIDRKEGLDGISQENKKIPVLKTSLASAQMIKYGSNAFLATRISFINELAQLCEYVGADINEVSRGMGLDPRIGGSYLQPGPGFGGPCLEKDLNALNILAKNRGLSLKIFKEVLERNNVQIDEIIRKIEKNVNINESLITIWGLSFKAGTDDTRNSSSLRLIENLSAQNAKIKIFDPVATLNDSMPKNLEISENPYLSVENSDILVIMTEWPEFLEYDYSRIFQSMRGKNIVDARDILNSSYIKSLGFSYSGIGVI
jgi:UDPglucose 6-dehydrogenase